MGIPRRFMFQQISKNNKNAIIGGICFQVKVLLELSRELVVSSEIIYIDWDSKA